MRTIGAAKVTMRFTGNDNGGNVVISSDLIGEGKWVPEGDGVKITTTVSVFHGGLNGDALSGQRITNDGSIPITGWSVGPGPLNRELKPNASDVEGQRSQKKAIPYKR